jgi:pyruvate/2-oxoglutarate dehydrogenase complex dihydrolipoamide acyltransferase (E2) component
MSFNTTFTDLTTGVSLNGTVIAFGLTALALIAYDLVHCVTAVHRKFSDKELNDRLTEMERNIELLRYMYTMEEPESDSSEQPQEQPQEQPAAQEQPQEQPQPPPAAPAAATPEADRHAALKRLLLNKEVHLTYKKQNFVAKIADKATAPHGYQIVCGNEEYNTPSHFSYTKKLAVNPNIHSDNGWDSIYVVTGADARGKQTKLSLKEFIAASAQE